MGVTSLVEWADRPDAESAIVFVHGYGGSAEGTFGEFPALIRDRADVLADWAIYSFGYQSKLLGSETEPGLDELSKDLYKKTTRGALKNVRRLAFVAHSMGGLLVQKAIVDSDLVERVTHVILYGTPSAGMRKSRMAGRLLGRQQADMSPRSSFIKRLRGAWRAKFGDAKRSLPPGERRPFKFWTVAGDGDWIVPASSSLMPFAPEDQVVVPGGHIHMVKPDTFDHESVQTAFDAMGKQTRPGGRWNSASVAIELGHFQEAVERLEPNVDELDDRHLVQLALALDAVGRRDDSISVLERKRDKGTDALGTLAGRFKRRWWTEGLTDAAKRALELYQEGYAISSRVSAEDPSRATDPDQAYYHGINVAFLKFAFQHDTTGAEAVAEEVLQHAANATRKDAWQMATIGEANLYLRNGNTALDAYRAAVETQPDPWQVRSMYDQAIRIADLLQDHELEKSLHSVFIDAPEA